MATLAYIARAVANIIATQIPSKAGLGIIINFNFRADNKKRRS